MYTECWNPLDTSDNSVVISQIITTQSHTNSGSNPVCLVRANRVQVAHVTSIDIKMPPIIERSLDQPTQLLLVIKKSKASPPRSRSLIQRNLFRLANVMIGSADSLLPYTRPSGRKPQCCNLEKVLEGHWSL